MEFVWVVPRSALFPEATPNGFLALEADQLESRLLGPARDEGFFIERRYAETHPEFKQPIPYVAICQEDKVLCLTRLSTQGEKRLHGKKSIGVGGHINPCDQSDGDIFANACHRELHEELILPSDAVLLDVLFIFVWKVQSSILACSFLSLSRRSCCSFLSFHLDILW